MELSKVKISELKANPHNPPQRVRKSTNSYKLLRNSIKKAGQIEPITISSDNIIVNGTRRTTVMSELGHEEIYANKLNCKSADLFDDMFLECNVVEKISGAQWAWRWLQGATVPSRWKSVCNNLKNVAGIGCVRRIVDLNLSPMSFSAGLSMFRSYTNTEDTKTLKQAVYWMLNVESAYKMKWLIGEYVPVQLLLNAVRDKKSISLDGHWDES